jgi:hypothetical protein
MGVPPMMEITTTRMGWNRFAFLRKEGYLNIRKMREKGWLKRR